MERSERSSTGKTAATPSAPGRAPGRSPATGEAGAAAPLDPDDDSPEERAEGDELAEGDAAPGTIRAEPWEPDARLMRALGLELEELRACVEAGDPDRTDAPACPVSRRAAAQQALLGGAAADPAAAEAPAPDERLTCDGRPPWW
jgi:hypothetical protein